MLVTPALVVVGLVLPSGNAGLNRLYAEEAQATSYIKSNWNKYTENYHPSYVLAD